MPSVISPRRLRRAPGALLFTATCLALGGCASSSDASRAPSRNAAWIVGDPNSCSGSQVVQLTIRSVDGISTVSGTASFLEGDANPCTYPVQVEVPPGHHTIGIAYTAGQDVMPGAFSLNVTAGRIYDVSAHAVGASYWFEAKPR